jgi:hypothetical protein
VITQETAAGSRKTKRAGATVAARLFVRLLAGSWVVCLCSCTSAVHSGFSTALDGTDLVTMTDDMSRKIVADPDVQAAIAREGQLRVVVQPVENLMTAEVLPRGPAETFTARVRTLLSKHAPDRFLWVMNRDAFYDLRGRELEGGFELGPSPDAIDPRYALQAKFSSITNESSKRRTSYYLCVYELTNLEDRTILWTDRYEVKKTAVKGFLD